MSLKVKIVDNVLQKFPDLRLAFSICNHHTLQPLANPKGMGILRITKNQTNSLALFRPSSVEDVSYGVSVGFVDADVWALSAVYPLLYAIILVSWDAGALVELAFEPVSRHISPLVCSVL